MFDKVLELIEENKLAAARKEMLEMNVVDIGQLLRKSRRLRCCGCSACCRRKLPRKPFLS